MPMAMQFVTKNTDNPNKPIEMIKKIQIKMYVDINGMNWISHNSLPIDSISPNISGKLFFGVLTSR